MMSSPDNDSDPILTVCRSECMELHLLIIEFCTIAIALRIIVSIAAISEVLRTPHKSCGHVIDIQDSS
eukprot:4833279-Ditylum_brightwellii.AAC.1